MKYIAIIFITLLCLSSCRCPKVLTDTKTVTDTITIEKKVVERDTVFYTPQSKVETKIPLDELCNKYDAFNPIIEKKGNAILDVRRGTDKNKVGTRQDNPSSNKDKETQGTEYIYITAECDSIALAAKIKEHFNNTTKVKETVKTEFVEVKYIPFWVKLKAYIGEFILWLLGAGVLFLIIRFSITKKLF